MIYDPKTKIIKIIDFGTALQFETSHPTQYKCVGTVISTLPRHPTLPPKSSKKPITRPATYGLSVSSFTSFS